jgi:hypothetical protein
MIYGHIFVTLRHCEKLLKAHNLHFRHRLTTSIADSRDYFSRSRSKVDDVSQRQSPAKMEL